MAYGTATLYTLPRTLSILAINNSHQWHYLIPVLRSNGTSYLHFVMT